MAEWRPLHQPLSFRSGLEAGGQAYNPPLLPYEKSLIASLDVSEEEYKKFVRYAMQRAYVRPVEYSNIPDIVAAEPFTLFGVTLVTAAGAKTTAGYVATLAVGVALTAASTLLAPKAPSLETDKIKRKKLADQVGPSRFNQTTSFDNAPSLAELNQPIPIPFGKRGAGADGVLTGGLILVPALVWSRLYAYGTYQAYEGVYVAGEFGVDEPDLGGILIGTQALNSLGNRDFAFYWSSKQGSNRPATLLYGTQGGQETGTVGRQVFTAPTNNGQFSNDFSMAYTPSGDTRFGTSTPIHNGTAYRFNWQIISAPFATTKGEDNKDARLQTQAQRRKIAGSQADVLHTSNEEAGQPGVGRGYSRSMGFTKYNGVEYRDKTFIRTVSAGDEAVFEIDNRDKPYKDFAKSDFAKTEVNLDDLIAQAKSWRERASNLLVVGSKWIIGATGWIVTKRSVDGSRTFITFKCVALLGKPEFGLAGTKTIEGALGGYDGLKFNETKHCGALFFNVCREHVATIRPVRKDAEVIELGIRSQVWNKASGLCNFNSIPSPQKLLNLDQDDVVLETGRIDKYFKRSSCFSIWVRPVKEYGKNQNSWVPIPKVFCVQGSAPINQNNYLRIRPRTRGFYEYRLIPRTGTDIGQNYPDTEEVIVLDASTDVPYLGNTKETSDDYGTRYGDFRVTTQGRQVSVRELRTNDELQTKPGEVTPAKIEFKPTQLTIDRFFSDSGSPYLIKAAFLTDVLGYARNNPATTKSKTVQVEIASGKTIDVNIIADSVSCTEGLTCGRKYMKANGENPYQWENERITVAASNGDFQVGNTFNITKNVTSNNDFRDFVAARSNLGPTYNKVTIACRVTAVQSSTSENVRDGERIFERNSQISDCSHYTEITKSNDSGPEHEVVYVNEYMSNESPALYDGMSTIGFAVKSTGDLAGISQMRLYAETGIPVERLIEGSNAPSNLFADLVHYLLSNKTQGVGNVVPAELIDKDSLRTTARFLRANKIFYDGVLEDSESFRNFIYDTAPLQLCTFTIKNGRFGMQPALPFDPSNHQISLQPIQAEQIFTAGNIIEGSLQLQYIDVSQRANIRALVTWRVPVENNLPYQASALLFWADLSVDKQSTTEQAFDLTEFCTNREQALRTARFLLSTRRRVTKTVSFKTVPDALGVQPGSYIRVITEASTYSSAANGAITDAGTLVSITDVEDGTYDAVIYNPTTEEVIETQLTISGNQISDSKYHGSLFTLLSGSTDYSVYQIEQLTLEEDGLVSISAVEVPTDASGVSIVAKDVLTESNFTILE